MGCSAACGLNLQTGIFVPLLPLTMRSNTLQTKIMALTATAYRELYERLVAAYRKTPGQHVPASREAGCSYRAARNLWEQGIKGPDGRVAIKEVLQAEGVGARANRAREEAIKRAAEPGEVEAAEQDRIETRKKLAKLCAAARDVTTAGFSVVGTELKAVFALAERIAKDIDTIKADPWVPLERDDKGKVLRWRRTTVREMLELQGLVAATSTKLVRAAMTALQMERLHMGLPTEIVGTQDMTLEEAVREIETANAELAQARERGLLVLQGGKTG